MNVAAQTDAHFTGNIPDVGVALVVFSGGSLADLVAAAEAEGAITVSSTVDGEFIIHVVGAPAFVNAEFAAQFAGGFEAQTPLVLVKR